MAGFVGSNPTRPIKSSVRSPPEQLKITSSTSQTSLQSCHMRDIYNRKKKLADWIKRVNEDIQDPDKEELSNKCSIVSWRANKLI
jgi:hypothetical protein